MAHRIDDIFNDCLDRMSQGESLESCLGSYPEDAEELHQLLRTYRNVNWRSSMLIPSPEFKARARSQMWNAQMQELQAAQSKRSGSFRWRRALVPTLAALLLVVFSGAGTVAASSNALPDQTLYPVKLATEEVRLTFAFSDFGKAKLHVELAETRIHEITAMAQKGMTEEILSAAEKLSVHLEEANLAIERVEVAESLKFLGPPDPTGPEQPSTIPPPEKTSGPSSNNGDADTPRTSKRNAKQLKDLLEKSLSNNVTALENVLEKAPDKSKPAIQNAIDRSRLRQIEIQPKTDANNGSGTGATTRPVKPDISPIDNDVKPTITNTQDSQPENGGTHTRPPAGGSTDSDQQKTNSTGATDNETAGSDTGDPNTDLAPSR